MLGSLIDVKSFLEEYEAEHELNLSRPIGAKNKPVEIPMTDEMTKKVDTMLDVAEKAITALEIAEFATLENNSEVQNYTVKIAEDFKQNHEKVDEQMVAHFQPQIEQIKKYVGRRIGRFEKPIYTRDSFFGNSAFTDLIHNLQMQISGADISFNAPLSFNTVINAGDVTQADMFKLYRFENLLYVLRMTGDEIRRHLEYSYDMWTNTMTSPDDHALLLNDDSKEDQQRTGFQNYTFNFDSACGIDYEVDLTKPNGQKVRILRMSNGQPFEEKRWYKVVMNSYRANGGGELLTRGAGIPIDSIDSRVLFHTEMDQRHYLTLEIERMGTINPEPNNNWRFVPEALVKPALERDRILLFGE